MENAPVDPHAVEMVPLDLLRPHPRNYRRHPEDQIAQLQQSLREYGFYRNVVIARDGTILAGHGIVAAAVGLGTFEVAPCVRLDVDPDDPRAWKVVAADNELPRLAEVDDRALSELLRDIREGDPIGLLGTGFDDQMLANLVFVTRPASEIGTMDEAALWAGMPEFEAGDSGVILTIHCESDEDRAALIQQLGVTISKKMRQHWSCWWPPQKRQDLNALRFEDGVEEAAG